VQPHGSLVFCGMVRRTFRLRHSDARQRIWRDHFMDLTAASERLESERTRLLALRSQAEIAGSEETSQQESLSDLSSADQHPADQGTETFEREQSLSLLEQLDASSRM
jgi:hypothetical protein